VDRYDLNTAVNFAVGIGFKYKDRYGLELGYFTDRDLLNSYQSLGSDFKSYSIVLGYSLF
jgi:hypothetical protein